MKTELKYFIPLWGYWLYLVDATRKSIAGRATNIWLLVFVILYHSLIIYFIGHFIL